MEVLSKERLEQQIEFLKAADRLKQISRKTSILGGSRLENSAEHSWHVILLAMTLAEHSEESIDLLRVIQMFALHDLGELDGGDTFHYAKSASTDAKETECIERLLALLPADQGAHFRDLWEEFSTGVTVEAQFAQAVDRIWPCIQNYANNGGSWLQFKISLEQAIEKNKHIEKGSRSLWRYVEALLRDADAQGLMYRESQTPAGGKAS